MSGWSVPTGPGPGGGAPGTPGDSPVLQTGNITTVPNGQPATAAVRLVEGHTYALDFGLPEGSNGVSPTLQAGNITTVAAGGQATAAVRALGGGAYAVDVGIPTGATGAAGVSPTLQVGNVTTVAAGGQATAAVRDLGNHVYAVDLGLPAGAGGAAGVAPTLQVGNVTTVAAGGQATAAVRDLGNRVYAVDLGIPAGAAGAAGAGANVSTLRRVYLGSVEITSSNSSYGFTGAVPSGATEVDIECVGPGASGFSARNNSGNTNQVCGAGGRPGTVARTTKRVVDVPSPIAVTIGAGGARIDTSTSYNTCISNPGGTTSFGSILQALGGAGGSYATAAEAVAVVALNSNGSALGQSEPGIPGARTKNATAGQGPGAGGASVDVTEDANNAVSGNGGASGSHLPNSTKAGAQGRAAAGQGYTGINPASNASDVFGYGSGGAGANGWTGATPGGLPGGGGGGGYITPSQADGYNYGAAGGRGAVRLHFYRYEAP